MLGQFVDKFANIVEFAKFRKECLFCQQPMRVVLTNFVGLKDSGIPVIKAPLVDEKFNFYIEHTTPRFNIKADVVVDANANVLLFDNFTNGELPAIDEYVVRQAFEDYRPYVELYCTNKRCGLMYHLWSESLKLKKIPSVKGAWQIEPLVLILEGIKVKHYVVHNMWNHNMWDQDKTYIYTTRNPDAQPIETPRIDFTTMDKIRLTNRIQMIVTFS